MCCWWLQELPRSKPRSSARPWSLPIKPTCSHMLLARLVMRVSRIGLPNIIARRAIVPELWQYEVTAKHMAAQALALLTSPQHATSMRLELATLRSQLGAPGVPARVANGIIHYSRHAAYPHPRLSSRGLNERPGRRWENGRSMHPVLRSLLPVAAAWLVKAICATLRVQVLRGDDRADCAGSATQCHLCLLAWPSALSDVSLSRQRGAVFW